MVLTGTEVVNRHTFRIQLSGPGYSYNVLQFYGRMCASTELNDPATTYIDTLITPQTTIDLNQITP